MSRFLDRLRPPAAPVLPQRMTLAELADQVQYLGTSYPLGLLNQTMPTGNTEDPDTSFRAMVDGAYRAGGPVFSCVLARGLLFSEARFQWQSLTSGRPGQLFGNPALSVLERPWPNGTTRELLWRAEQDVSMAGNFFVRLARGRLWRLRPDWVTIVLGSQTDAEDPAEAIDCEVVGYIFGRPGPGGRRTVLLREEVAHWSPIPDPLANYRGMSWLTPILREVGADNQAVTHKQQFFNNAATPNLVVMPDATVSYDEFKQFKDDFQDQHEGAWNAYKTLFLGGGSTVTTVGLGFKDMDYKALQGISETRIASAAGVPPIIAGFSEGLASATYSNYGMARRKFGDHWARPQWGSFSAAVEPLLARPSGPNRLWYDDRDIAFLREDQGDEATIRSTSATTIRALIEAGYEPDAAVAYASTGNADLLLGRHTGRVSVQLLPADGSADGGGADGTGNSDETGGRGTLDPVDGINPIEMATLLQKLYLATPGKVVVSTEEARRLARKAGIDLDAKLPDELLPPTPAA